MDDYLLKQTYQLKDALLSDFRVVKLNEIEKEMEKNEEVMRLSYLKDVAITKYCDIPDMLKEDKEIAFKQISIAKENLQNHPLVKEYLKAFKEVRELYNEINVSLFSGLNAELCPKK